MKKNLIILVLALVLISLGSFAVTGEDTQTKSAVMIIAWRGFNEMEYSRPREILENGCVSITVAGRKVGEAVSDSQIRRYTAQVELPLEEVDVSKYDAVIFIGGTGASRLFKNEQAHRIAQEAAESGLILAAICSAPVILSNAGVLEGHSATVYHLTEPENLPALKAGGAIYVNESVVISQLTDDGEIIITASGGWPATCRLFAEAILEALGLSEEEGEQGSS